MNNKTQSGRRNVSFFTRERLLYLFWVVIRHDADSLDIYVKDMLKCRNFNALFC